MNQFLLLFSAVLAANLISFAAQVGVSLFLDHIAAKRRTKEAEQFMKDLKKQGIPVIENEAQWNAFQYGRPMPVEDNTDDEPPKGS